MAIVDANYRFTYIDIGCNGRVSDAGVLRDSTLGTTLFGEHNDMLNTPSPRPLSGRVHAVPFVVVGDDAFPLQNNLMKSYPLGIRAECVLLSPVTCTDALYHENTAVCDGLPRSYLIKQLRSDMNIHIQRTPGGSEGAEVDVEQELKCAIHSIIAEHPNAKHFSVKFCGDGTHVARRAGMCLMSFSVTSPGVRTSKSACHHAVAVV